MHNKKGQAAMEFLMTYGWAILIVLIVLAGLFFLGVFNPNTKNNCSSDSPFNCIDVKLAAGAAGDSIVVDVNQVSGTPTFGSYTGTCTSAAWLAPYTANSRNTITLTCPNGLAGDTFTGSFKITYTSAIGGLPHIANVEYSGKQE